MHPPLFYVCQKVKLCGGTTLAEKLFFRPGHQRIKQPGGKDGENGLSEKEKHHSSHSGDKKGKPAQIVQDKYVEEKHGLRMGGEEGERAVQYIVYL